MHKVVIPEHVRQRVISRQGRWNVHDDVPVKNTAFVVVDLQNYFMAPGQALEIPVARAIVPNVNRLALALRQAGGLVVWIRTIYSDEAMPSWSHFHRYVLSQNRNSARSEILRSDAFGSQLWKDLEVRPGDLVIEKTKFSAFVGGSSTLESELRQRDITSVWVGGTTTNCCCESTARDAMLLDFRTTMISDANADRSDEEHNASLIAFCNMFGDVASTDDLIARLKAQNA